ncbi:MAG: hypothetical protein JEY91_09190, partial [Spirochaetaceae bacterium]|nr:hypothetical protein [Spirochaetaceae bacterium]
VGKWIQIVNSDAFTTTYYDLIIASDSYSVTQVTRILDTGVTSSSILEKGTVSESNFSELIMTKTHERDSITFELLQIPTQYQESRTVVWSRVGNTLTLVDAINEYTNGEFTED